MLIDGGYSNPTQTGSRINSVPVQGPGGGSTVLGRYGTPGGTYPMGPPSPDGTVPYGGRRVPYDQPVRTWNGWGTGSSAASSSGSDPWAAFGGVQGYYEPTFNQFDHQNQSLLAQLGYNQAGYDQMVGAAQQSYNSRAAQLQNQIASTRLDKANVSADQRYYDVYGRELGNQYLTNVAGVANDQNRANYGAETGVRNSLSSGVASGSFTSQGTRDNVMDVMKQLGFDTQGLKLKRQGLDSQYQVDTANVSRQKEQLANRQKQLDLVASNYGLQGDDLKAQLQQTLARYGLDRSTSVQNIMDGLYSNDQNRLKFANQILMDAINSSLYGGS